MKTDVQTIKIQCLCYKNSVDVSTVCLSSKLQTLSIIYLQTWNQILPPAEISIGGFHCVFLLTHQCKTKVEGKMKKQLKLVLNLMHVHTSLIGNGWILFQIKIHCLIATLSLLAIPDRILPAQISRSGRVLEISRFLGFLNYLTLSGGTIQLQCASCCAPFYNSNKQPQPYKTEAATNNFSSIQLPCNHICEGKFIN